MNDDNKAKPRVFFARKDNEGRRYASGIWDDGTKVYFKNFRETNNMVIADVDYQTTEQYENKQGKLVYRHKVCGALSLTPTKATLIIELNDTKERLTCEPRQVNAKATGEPLLVLDFGNGSSLNPYVDDLYTADAESNKEALDQISEMVDDSVPF